MELSKDQQDALKQQKEQCIFCKIIKGEVPSKKVYEDDKIIAILDINPATKGHTLVMPKEHYPIMPLIPEEVFKHLFSKVREIDKCIKEALLCKEVVMFIANGGAAGQQSMHFMLHLIPRDRGDGLDMLDIFGGETTEEELKQVEEKCAILSPMLQKNLHLLGFTEAPKMTKEQLIQVINQNPELKKIMIENPDQFKATVPNHPQLKEMFKDQDIDAILEEVKK